MNNNSAPCLDKSIKKGSHKEILSKDIVLIFTCGV